MAHCLASIEIRFVSSTTGLYDIPEGSLQLCAAFQTFNDRIQHAVRFDLNGLQPFGYRGESWMRRSS